MVIQVTIPVMTKTNTLVRRIEAAESGISAIKNLIWEAENLEKGGNIVIIGNEKLMEGMEPKIRFGISKKVDTEMLGQPLKNIEELTSKLKEEVRKLDEAIITELIRGGPQE